MSLRPIKGGLEGGTLKLGLAEYIWLDDRGQFYAKVRTIQVAESPDEGPVPSLPHWTGNILYKGKAERVILSVCHYLPDPLRPQPSFLALCEIMTPDGKPHPANNRAQLRAALDEAQETSPSWWGFQQRHLIHDTSADKASQLAERHLGACVDAGLLLHSASMYTGNDGENTEREFKMGPRGLPALIDPDAPTALMVADHFLFARWLLIRIVREHRASISWTSVSLTFSTAAMRVDRGALDQFRKDHITAVTGAASGYMTYPNPLPEEAIFPVVDLKWGVTREGDVGYGYLSARQLRADLNPWAAAAHLLNSLSPSETAADEKEGSSR